MAQLKDLLVSGPSRFVGEIFSNEAQLTTINAPTSSGGTTYGPGTNGQVLKSNGSSVYWTSDTNTDTIPSAYCTSSSATPNKAASLSGYSLLTNQYFMLTLTNSNTVIGAFTLNVNNKGAIPVYINGLPSSDSNWTMPAGTYLVFYDGTNYHVRTDGKIPNYSSISDETIDNIINTVDTGYISGVPNARQIPWTGASVYGSDVQSAIEYVANLVVGAMRNSY